MAFVSADAACTEGSCAADAPAPAKAEAKNNMNNAMARIDGGAYVTMGNTCASAAARCGRGARTCCEGMPAGTASETTLFGSLTPRWLEMA
mmetsp:Transcript_16980/g.42410  ORF Transcript_16980/g.42410 Transcript_16980/m.42410 type:complete len:91 (-) Transcript_16980:18-290(-)